jgi:hypothetical protein
VSIVTSLQAKEPKTRTSTPGRLRDPSIPKAHTGSGSNTGSYSRGHRGHFSRF